MIPDVLDPVQRCTWRYTVAMTGPIPSSLVPEWLCALPRLWRHALRGCRAAEDGDRAVRRHVAVAKRLGPALGSRLLTVWAYFPTVIFSLSRSAVCVAAVMINSTIRNPGTGLSSFGSGLIANAAENTAISPTT